MAQRYRDLAAQAYMARGLCPECGKLPSDHSDELLFFAPCSLRQSGVLERIETYREDQERERQEHGD